MNCTRVKIEFLSIDNRKGTDQILDSDFLQPVDGYRRSREVTLNSQIRMKSANALSPDFTGDMEVSDGYIFVSSSDMNKQAVTFNKGDVVTFIEGSDLLKNRYYEIIHILPTAFYGNQSLFSKIYFRENSKELGTKIKSRVY